MIKMELMMNLIKSEEITQMKSPLNTMSSVNKSRLVYPWREISW